MIVVLLLVVAAPGLAQERATIRGTVVGLAGAPLATVTLIVTNLATGIDRRAASEDGGEFVFGGLAPGAYRLRVDDDMFAPWSQDQIVLAPGQQLDIRIQLQPRVPGQAVETARATVAGTVIGPDGRPRGDVLIVLTNAQTGIDRRAVSEPSGAYVFGGLAPGAYRLRIEADAAQPFAVDGLALAPGEQRQVDIRLQPLPVAAPAPPAAAPAAAAPVTPAPADAAAPPAPEPPQVRVDAAAPRAPTVAAVPDVTADTGEFEAWPDRWRFDWPAYQRYMPAQGMPWVVGSPFDPYNQNAAKGDFPLGASSVFLNLNLQFNSTLNPRRVAARAPQDQVFYNQNAVMGLELFGGDTVFEPKRWAVRGTAVVNVNANVLNSLSVGGLGQPLRAAFGEATPALEEAFVERRLAVHSAAYDFVTLRGGMQNFNSDFRGYVFADNQLGVRLFGNARSNRDQYNVAYFSMRTRDAASQLHEFTSRNQDVVIANYYVQDFGHQGFTAMFNVHLNRDRGPETDPHLLQVMYAGFHGDGRWGTWSVSHAFYEAFGRDDDSRVARLLAGGRPAPVDISARMAAVELARDADWLRVRLSAFYASGDNRADPGKARGFDVITDNPNLAGGQFMFWTQQGTTIDGLESGGLLSEKFSLVPSLRSKFTDRANFVNPGLLVANGGLDLRVSPSLKAVVNASWLRFADATVLRQLRPGLAGFEDETIGLDLSGGAKFRPFVNENLFVVPGASVLLPRGGFASALGSARPLFSMFAAIQIAY